MSTLKLTLTFSLSFSSLLSSAVANDPSPAVVPVPPCPVKSFQIKTNMAGTLKDI